MLLRNRFPAFVHHIFLLPVRELLLICTGFGALIAALYGNLLTGWWGWDDPQILKQAFQYAPWEYFLVPEVWREFQPANLNPWIILSFDLDLALFGLNPMGFYAHHLFSLWLVALGTYILLRLWLNELWSVLGVVLFVCSAPVTNMVYQLMTRHYLEGLLFSVLMSYLYVRALREERPLLAWLGGALFFLAVSAKEVYVIQVVFLLLIPERDLRRRLFMASPFFLVLGIYALWRRYMLGTWIGGYRPSMDWSAVYHAILKIPSYIFGDSMFAAVSLLLVFALMVYITWRSRYALILIAGAFLLLLGPIVPVINISDPNRLLVFSVWALSTGVALSLGELARSSTRRLVISLTVLVVIGFSIADQGWRIRPGLASATDGFAAHGRFIMEADEEQVLLPSVRFGNWFATGLMWLRENMLKEKSPVMVFDEIDLPEHNTDSLRFFRYDVSCRRLEDVTDRISKTYREWKGKLRERSVSVEFDYMDGMISWQLGPYKRGVYSMITYGPSGSKMRLPPSGIQRIEIPEPVLFRVRYDSPDGWTTYSPLLQFDGNKLRNRPGNNGNLK